MDAIIRLLEAHGSALVFVTVLLCRAGAPLPGGAVLVLAGALAALGQLSAVAVVVLSLAANLLGDALWFVGGRRHGYRVMRLLCRISLSPDTCVRQSEGLFSRWGGVSLIAAKFVPGVSVVAAPMAGALRMSWSRFIAWDLVAAAIWTAAYLVLGLVFRTQLRTVLDVLADAGTKAGVGLALAAALALAARWLKRRAFSAGDVPRLSAAELHDRLSRDDAPAVLDVRGALAREASGTVPGARAVGLDELSVAAPGLQGGEVVLYCNCPNDVSAVRGAVLLRQHGVTRVYVLAGGYDGWSEWLQQQAPALPLPVAAAAG